MFTVIEWLVPSQYNGRWFFASLDSFDKRDVVRSGLRYFIARDTDGAWWYIPFDRDAPEDLLGPYTYEQAVTIARLLS